MAAKRKPAAKAAAKAKPLDARRVQRAAELRAQAVGERHTGTALERRVAALEELVAALTEAR